MLLLFVFLLCIIVASASVPLVLVGGAWIYSEFFPATVRQDVCAAKTFHLQDNGPVTAFFRDQTDFVRECYTSPYAPNCPQAVQGEVAPMKDLLQFAESFGVYTSGQVQHAFHSVKGYLSVSIQQEMSAIGGMFQTIVRATHHVIKDDIVGNQLQSPVDPGYNTTLQVSVAMLQFLVEDKIKPSASKYFWLPEETEQEKEQREGRAAAYADYQEQKKVWGDKLRSSRFSKPQHEYLWDEHVAPLLARSGRLVENWKQLTHNLCNFAKTTSQHLWSKQSKRFIKNTILQQWANVRAKAIMASRYCVATVGFLAFVAFFFYQITKLLLGFLAIGSAAVLAHLLVSKIKLLILTFLFALVVVGSFYACFNAVGFLVGAILHLSSATWAIFTLPFQAAVSLVGGLWSVLISLGASGWNMSSPKAQESKRPIEIKVDANEQILFQYYDDARYYFKIVAAETGTTMVQEAVLIVRKQLTGLPEPQEAVTTLMKEFLAFLGPTTAVYIVAMERTLMLDAGQIFTFLELAMALQELLPNNVKHFQTFKSFQVPSELTPNNISKTWRKMTPVLHPDQLRRANTKFNTDEQEVLVGVFQGMNRIRTEQLSALSNA